MATECRITYGQALMSDIIYTAQSNNHKRLPTHSYPAMMVPMLVRCHSGALNPRIHTL